MTREERVKKLRCLITCMKCEVSGNVCDDNCPTLYNAGNMGEIIENLEEIAKALEQEPILDKIRAEISKTWHTHPQSRYEEGLKDQALRDIKIIDRYKAESEGKE